MDFDPARYGPAVARILALEGQGNRLMPLRWTQGCKQEARQLLNVSSPQTFLPAAPEPGAALAGLWFYLDCFDEAHQAAEADEKQDHYYWHALVHRREGDPGNAAYWFRKVGAHPIFPHLAAAAPQIHRDFRAGAWDPNAFVSFCERAKERPGSGQEQAAMRIQLAEWQLLFDHCARPH
jgi:hypothetical protein